MGLLYVQNAIKKSIGGDFTTRIEFTININHLLHDMILLGEHPIGDFWKRSDEEQHRLWQIGRDENGNRIGDTVTNCDGIKIPSAHQSGKALDILFIENGKISNPNMGWDHWHKRWEGWGGAKIISWDKGHFE